MVKFDVESVRLFNNELPVSTGDIHIQTLTKKRVEHFFDKNKAFVRTSFSAPSNFLLGAVHTSYDKHIGLKLSPDVIWVTILQGISTHVEKNPEKFRHVFVSHSGKLKLSVDADYLVRGDTNNNWNPVIEQFSSQIAQHLNGPVPKLAQAVRFSTTGSCEAICHDLTFMDCVKSYFSYTVRTKCGIPNIELLGTQDDWVRLTSALDILDELDLGAWKNQLLSILSQFVLAYTQVDQKFWSGMYKRKGGRGSGSITKICGWISKLFLYIKDEINPNAISGRKLSIDPALFPRGISKTPFVWKYLGHTLHMHFNAGLVGCVQDGQTLVPELGWFITYQ